MSTHRPGAAGPRGGPMAGMFGAPPAKTKDFKTSLKRLLSELGPERKVLSLVLSLITVSVVIGSFGPKILGRATNYIFYGFLGHQLPAGV
ncbi:MAG: ABC transporter ATP-binding protein, partial [Actinobacteria bacterium]|nr:ABC transporter ATP-binding protein [Actinomycetota bacterium]